MDYNSKIYTSSKKLKCPECGSFDIDYGMRAGKNNSSKPVPASCCECDYEFPIFEKDIDNEEF